MGVEKMMVNAAGETRENNLAVDCGPQLDIEPRQEHTQQRVLVPARLVVHGPQKRPLVCFGPLVGFLVFCFWFVYFLEFFVPFDPINARAAGLARARGADAAGV